MKRTLVHSMRTETRTVLLNLNWEHLSGDSKFSPFCATNTDPGVTDKFWQVDKFANTESMSDKDLQ